MYWLAKIKFDTGEVKKNGDPVVIRAQILVQAESPTHVEAKLADHLRNANPYECESISVSKIESVLE
jgi:hypothetical protein